MATVSIPYVYALKAGGSIAGVSPLELQAHRRSHIGAADDVMEVPMTRVLNPPKFEDEPTPAPVHPPLTTYLPLSEAMGSAAPLGEYIVFQDCISVEPEDGDLVVSYVSTRPRPRLRWLDQLLHRPAGPGFWWEHNMGRAHAKRIGIVERFVIRRFGHDSEGRETLTADDPAFPSWTAGKNIDGLDVAFTINGVLAPYEAIMHGQHEVMVRRK